MEIFSGKKILYIWETATAYEIEGHVGELKKIALNVQLENLERIEMGK